MGCGCFLDQSNRTYAAASLLTRYRCLKQPQRTDDVWLLRLRLLLNQAQAIISTQIDESA